MALDSDTNNPDAALWVKFYDDVQENPYKSSQEGRPIFEDVVKIQIAVPSNPTVGIDRVMVEEDKLRFPVQWAHYINTRSGESQGGTPIEHLGFLSKAVVETLKYAKFYSVEQIANSADNALQTLGMSVGMDPLMLRERAIRFLEGAKDNAAQSRMSQELAQRDAEIEALKGQLQQVIEMMQAKEEKRGPGRPKQEAA